MAGFAFLSGASSLTLSILRMGLWFVAAMVFVLNLPFGLWRARVRRFSWPWILAIHLPVPLIIALRICSGLGWRFITFPVLIGAFFAGQFTVGKAGHLLSGQE